MIVRVVYILFVVLCSLTPLGAQRYIELQEQLGVVVEREDSLSRELDRARVLYRAGGDSMTIYRTRVVNVEQQLFDVRATKSQLLLDISTTEPIEQLPSTPQSIAIDKSRTISNSKYANEKLSHDELQCLRSAEMSDKRVAQRARSYVANYNELSRLVEEYGQAANIKSANSIISNFERLDSLNRTIANSIESQWQGVVDNKGFVYALLMERLGEREIFEAEQSLKIKAVELIDTLQEQSVEPKFLVYYASRLWQLEYEVLLARRLQLPSAVDSLRLVRDSLRMAGFDFPPLIITKRHFIDYEPVKFSTKAIYTGANPIPDGKHYSEGLIYRLHVGSFKSRQAASLFRGAYPICIIREKAGLLGYYIGSYATESEAQEARELLLKRGFRRPEVVEWQDGVERNLTRAPRPRISKYRVEIEGVSELSAELRSVITTQGTGRELSKTGATTFVVGLFDSMQSAEHLVESLKIMDSAIAVSIVEVK